MSCVNVWKAVVQCGDRNERPGSVNMQPGWVWSLEQRELQDAKGVCSVFQQEIWFSNDKKIIACEPSVSVCDYDLSVAVPLTDPWSSMISWMVVRPQMRNPTKMWREYRPHHRSSPLQQMELYQCGNSGRFAWTLLASAVQSRLRNTAYKLCNWIEFSVTAHWRNIAKYIGLDNTTVEHFSWRVQSNSDGVALSSLLSQKKKAC